VNIPPESAAEGCAKGHETQRQQYEARLESRLREAIQPLLRFGVPIEDAMCVAITIHRVSLLCGYDRAIKKFEKWAASRAESTLFPHGGVASANGVPVVENLVDQKRTGARPSEVNE
jgi:hypothetical protein